MNKLVSILLSLLVVVQSLLPGFYFVVNPPVVSAQEATQGASQQSPIPSPADTATPSPTDQIAQPSPITDTNQSNAPPPSEEPQVSPSATPQVSDTSSPTPTINPEQPKTGHLSAEILHKNQSKTQQLDFSPTNSITSASLTTDKKDYAPTDVAVISGTDFPKEANLKLIITASNYRFETDVKTDKNGSFSYFYQLDGTYRPLYNVEAQDENGNVLATTSFTDSAPSAWPNCNFHCDANNVQLTSLELLDANNNPINSCTTGQQIVAHLRATFHNNGSARSAVIVLGDLFQGNTLLMHLTTGSVAGVCGADTIAGGETQITNLANTTFTWTCGQNVTLQNLVISWDTPGNTCAAFFNNPKCSNRATDCNVSKSFTVTGPGSLVVHKTFTDGHTNNGITINITGTTSMSVVTNSSGDATFVPGNGTYTAHATEPAGYFESANTCINVTVVSGQVTNCTITDSPLNGTLTVNKVLSPSNDSGLFNLQIDGITAGSGSNVGNGGTTGAVTVTAGAHTVGETAGTSTTLLNYTTVISGDCDSQGSVSVPAGTSKTCTITNTRINNATITIIKDAQPNDAQDFAFTTSGSGLSNFSLDDDSDPTLSNTKTFNNLAAGSYTVTEGAVSGWSLSNLVCSDPTQNSTTNGSTATINLAPGETVTCTYTNTQDTATITVNKTLSPSNDPGKFNLQVDGQTAGIGANVGNGGTTGAIIVLTTSTHTASESAGTNTDLSDYTTAWVCNNNSSGSGTSVPAFSVTKNQSVICTFTNTRKTGILKVIKNVINDDGGTASASAFTLHVKQTGTDVTGSPAAGSSTGTDYTLNTNFYTVSEDPPLSGYANTTNDSNNGDCDANGGVTVVFGQTKTCTITNDDQPGHLIVHKITDPDSDTTTQFSITASGSDVHGNATQSIVGGGSVDYTVDAGTYSVSEEPLTGWDQTRNTCDSIVIANGQTKECTIINTKRGHLIVEKTTFPGGELTQFPIEASGSGTITGGGAGVITDALDQMYEVTPGVYSVTEFTPDGWDQTGNNCEEVGVNAGETSRCTFTNTKRGSISGTKFEANSDISTVGTLSGWVIRLLNSNNNQVAQTTTDQAGNFSFTNIAFSVYHLIEDLLSDWTQIFAPGSISLNPGEDSTDNNFGNFQNGQVVGTKFHDLNGNGERDEAEPGLEEWTIFIDENDNGELDEEETSTETDEDGNYQFPDLGPGTYIICEEEQSGWLRTKPAQSNCEEVTIENSNQTSRVDFGNQARGTITILKNVDTNGDGDLNDEEDILGATNWTWDIQGGEQNISTGQSRILPVGSYTISEDQKEGFELVGWSCSNEESGTTNSIVVNVSVNSEIVCTFTNKHLPAVLTITKTNNKNGADTSPGSNVLYSIILTLTGNNLTNVLVTDLLPDGFIYQGGSFTANSSIHGALSIGEPTYHSPGTWTLGNMSAGETITLTLLANINGSIDPGLYKDLGWAKGTNSGSTVLANANSGIFAGSEVNVNAGPNGTGYDVEKKETAEVLGISTSLPATGADIRWIILASFLLIVGLGSLGAGLAWRKKYEK